VGTLGQALYSDLRQAGFVTDDPAKVNGSGLANFRLYGFCALHYGTFDLAYEINDRYPAHRLNIQQLQQMGEIISEQLGKWINSDAGIQWHAHTHDVLQKRIIKREKHFKEFGITAAQRNEVDYLVLGY